MLFSVLHCRTISLTLPRSLFCFRNGSKYFVNFSFSPSSSSSSSIECGGFGFGGYLQPIAISVPNDAFLPDGVSPIFVGDWRRILRSLGYSYRLSSDASGAPVACVVQTSVERGGPSTPLDCDSPSPMDRGVVFPVVVRVLGLTLQMLVKISLLKVVLLLLLRMWCLRVLRRLLV